MAERLKPRGVHGRLMVTLGALAGLTLLAGVTGWLGFSRTESALETLQANSLSDLSLVLTLAERSASLAARAPYIAELRNERQIEAGREEIEQRLAEFTELAVSLPRLTQQNIPRPTDVPSAVRLAARLEGILRALLDVTGEQLAADAAMAHAQTAVTDFRATVRNLESVSAFEATSGPLKREQGRALRDLSELILQAIAVESTPGVRELAERFQRESEAVSASLRTSAAFAIANDGTEEAASMLEAKIAAMQPIFFDRLRQISTRNRSRFLLAAINTASAQLTATVSSLAAVVQNSALTRSEQTISVLRFGKSALLAVAALCFFAALGVASFVMRDVASNLRSATNAMTRLATGDRNAIVPGADRQDELGDLARAFSVFKEQAIEREELAGKLAENARTLQAIFDNLSDGLSLFDRDGQLVAWNPRFASLSGLETESLQGGVSLTQVLEHLSAEGIVARTVDGRPIDLQRFARNRFAPLAVLELKFPDGRVVEIRAGAMPNGGLIASLTDRTERRALERQLKQAQKMELVGQLTGGIAHDFNNRLAAIIGNLQMIQDDASASPKLRTRSLRALDAAEGGAAMTQRLLAFARRQHLQPQSTDLNDLVESLSDLIGYSLDPGIDLVLDLSEDLPPAMIDPGQLENALFNLVFNSRDAIEGRGRITISTAPRATNGGRPGEIVLSVRDTGIGMTKEVRKRVLEPFFTTKPFGRGSGLGLSMVYGFVRQSGGHIEIDSAPGKGTRIRLILPAAIDGATEQKSHDGRLAVPASRGERILVVEDDDLVRATALDMLAELGYSAKAVATAEAAEQAVLEQNFDLVFSDVVLTGGKNGPDLAESLALSRPDLPVLFCSGFARDSSADANGEAGGLHTVMPPADKILEKPYRRETLALRLREVLDDPSRYVSARTSTGASKT
ncbi:PAS-domain containing protein [Stappia sp. F7233]|uniref:histidine kinase n=1 Tax=Stappia albiluteola TaxID=2758565 RepID=A0A839A9J0_9HYPH|nr:ATP-binding protein [Stappia albiluteola]MBA5776041.1 PAS-domain containing protein [Stappia albiluteola]